MNSVLVLLVVACASFSRGEEGHALVMKAFKKCTADYQISEEEMKQVREKIGIPSSHNAKCMMACMMKEGKILNDGVYDKEPALIMSDILNKDDPEMAKKAKQVVENCSAKVGSDTKGDDCEFAFKMISCAAEEAQALGVSRPDF